jgi:hypothetical protein
MLKDSNKGVFIFKIFLGIIDKVYFVGKNVKERK